MKTTALAVVLGLTASGAVDGAAIPVTFVEAFPNGRISDSPPSYAVDGDINTYTWTTEAWNDARPSYLAFGFEKAMVNRIRLWKTADSGTTPLPGLSGEDIKDLSIEYTADSTALLSSREWQNVRGLQSGYDGVERLHAVAVNANGSVSGDLHDSPQGDGWASLTFDATEATGIRIGFRNPDYMTANHYRVGECQIHFDPDLTGVPWVQVELAIAGMWFPSANNLPVDGISVSGTRALARLGSSEVRLLDLSNLSVPVALGTWTSLLPISDAVLAGNFAYVGSWEPDFLSTVEILDFTDPAKPALRGYYDTLGCAQELLVRNNIAYVADAEGGLLILDVEDPGWPRRLGSYDTKGSIQHVEVYGSYGYVPDGSWLVTLDVSDPANPRRVGLYEVAGGISSLKAYGTKLYLSEGNGYVRILDVSNPAGIQVLGTYQGWGNPAQAMAASGEYLYLAKGTGGLHVLDVSDPTKPTYVTGAWTSSAEDVALMGKYALAAGGGKGLIIYEVQKALYPPLRAPVISGGTMTLTWATTNDVRFQKATNLVDAVWQDVPESEGTNTVTLPMTEPTAFFRLVKGPKQGQFPPGLIAWWPGDGNSMDIVGGHDAILRANATFADGYVSQAFSLDGDSDFVEVPDTPDLNFGTDDFTASLWVTFRSLDGEAVIIEKFVEMSWCSWKGWGLTLLGDRRLLFYLDYMSGCTCGGPPCLLSEPLSVCTDTWYAFAVRRSGTEGTIFFDGDPVFSGTIPPDVDVDSGSSLKFGHRGNPQDTPGSDDDRGFYLNGLVDEVTLFDRALTDAEIGAIYDAGSAGKAKPR